MSRDKAQTSAQSDQSLCYSLEYSMTVKLLSEQHLEFLNLKGGCTGPYESTLVKMAHCWKSFKAPGLLSRCDFLKFDMQHDHVLKKLIFDPHSQGRGAGSAGRIFATMWLHAFFHLI